jgi:alpha-beta hydrolase superfamily lysophospholipase
MIRAGEMPRAGLTVVCLAAIALWFVASPPATGAARGLDPPELDQLSQVSSVKTVTASAGRYQEMLLARRSLDGLGRSFASTQRVTLRTDDGATLAAMWYEPSPRPAPAVILVHMLHRSRRDWDALGHRLAGEGIGALAIDLRGHGDSQRYAMPEAGTEGGYASMAFDVRAARRYLASRTDVLQSRVGVAGASLGANVAALAAAADGSLASLALLSPSLDYQGLRIEQAVKKIGSRPVLLVAGTDDAYAARSARELQKAGGGPRELLVLENAGHGTVMLTRSEHLAGTLVDWFRRTLL